MLYGNKYGLLLCAETEHCNNFSAVYIAGGQLTYKHDVNLFQVAGIPVHGWHW